MTMRMQAPHLQQTSMHDMQSSMISIATITHGRERAPHQDHIGHMSRFRIWAEPSRLGRLEDSCPLGDRVDRSCSIDGVQLLEFVTIQEND